jgi:hypothetical protein
MSEEPFVYEVKKEPLSLSLFPLEDSNQKTGEPAAEGKEHSPEHALHPSAPSTV